MTTNFTIHGNTVKNFSSNEVGRDISFLSSQMVMSRIANLVNLKKYNVSYNVFLDLFRTRHNFSNTLPEISLPEIDTLDSPTTESMKINNAFYGNERYGLEIILSSPIFQGQVVIADAPIVNPSGYAYLENDLLRVMSNSLNSYALGKDTLLKVKLHRANSTRNMSELDYLVVHLNWSVDVTLLDKSIYQDLQSSNSNTLHIVNEIVDSVPEGSEWH